MLSCPSTAWHREREERPTLRLSFEMSQTQACPLLPEFSGNCAEHDVKRTWKMTLFVVKRIWNDPVWSKVIAAAVIGAAAIVGSYLLGWWPIIKDFFQSIISFALSRSSIPNWVLCILLFSIICWLVFIVVRVWQALLTETGIQDWDTYVSDNFFGIRWRWRYGQDYDVRHLLPFCPVCDLQVHPHEIMVFPGARSIYRCDRCNQLLAQIDMSWDELQDRVVREIHRKIRAETWETPTEQ